MLEPVRQYALKRLEESGEAEEVRQRHAMWSLALAKEAEPKLKGPEQEAWLERLETEHGNLRAALRWSLGGGDAALGLRVAAALWSFWFMHGYLSEGRRWLESGLSRSSLALAQTDAKALNGAGYIDLRQGEYGAAKGLLERSLALYRELQDREGIVSSLANLGLVALLGQREDIPVAALLEEALGLRPELKDRHTVANLLAFAGVVAGARGDWERAAALHQESLALFREARDARGIVSVLNTLGLIQLVQTDYEGASALFRESLRLGLEIDHKQIILYSFFGLACVATGQELPARAARLWGVAEGMSEAHGIVVSPIVRFHTRYEDCLTIARSQLDEEAFAAAWAEGRAMALEQAVAYALEGESTAPNPAPKDWGRRKPENPA
jgi:tetratricopeptide (TPR) repeat protein